jgi:hypothetical protein
MSGPLNFRAQSAGRHQRPKPVRSVLLQSGAFRATVIENLEPVTNQGKDGPLRGAMPGMKLGAGRGLRVVCRGFAGWGWAEGACWVWRAVRRHRFTLDRSRP